MKTCSKKGSLTRRRICRRRSSSNQMVRRSDKVVKRQGTTPSQGRASSKRGQINIKALTGGQCVGDQLVLRQWNTLYRDRMSRRLVS